MARPEPLPVPCPSCNVVAGVACRNVSGATLGHNHRERREAYTATRQCGMCTRPPVLSITVEDVGDELGGWYGAACLEHAARVIGLATDKAAAVALQAVPHG